MREVERHNIFTDVVDAIMNIKEWEADLRLIVIKELEEAIKNSKEHKNIQGENWL